MERSRIRALEVKTNINKVTHEMLYMGNHDEDGADAASYCDRGLPDPAELVDA